MTLVAHHPDPAINAEIALDALDAEKTDLAAGYPPRRWQCPTCTATHGRGHFQTVGVHRCMGCGYVGTGVSCSARATRSPRRCDDRP